MNQKREIKFRAWDCNLKIMISPYCELKDGNFWGEDCTNTGYSVKHEHVMQYTGLKDCKGKEIYEGDILSGHSDGNVKVEWSNVNGGWECFFDDEANIGIAEMCTWFGNNAIVIGNVFENPELLK